MCTHLHADHVGWNTRLLNGRWVPTFPNARYIMAETEFRYWQERVAREGPALNHGAFADSVLPVIASGQADLVSMDHRVSAGVQFEPAPGHTPGSVLIHIEDGGCHGVCTGDILHHPLQLDHPEMPSGYCEDPAASARVRVKLCEDYADTRTRILTAHFPDPSSGFIRRDGRRYRFAFDAR
jgi:glyoxylase-like metal-dependent hydrolase (beta-lactamase superfamily II)